MTRHRRTAALLAALPWLGAAAPQTEWRRVDTPNFVVIGEVGARELGEAATQFEGFHETLRRVLGQGAMSTAVPTIIFVFPSDRAFTPFMPVSNGKTLEVGGGSSARRTSTTSPSSATAGPAGCAPSFTSTRTW
jgi:hypothetical protein